MKYGWRVIITVIVVLLLLFFFTALGLTMGTKALNERNDCEKIKGSCDYYECLAKLGGLLDWNTQYLIKQQNCILEEMQNKKMEVK